MFLKDRMNLFLVKNTTNTRYGLNWSSRSLINLILQTNLPIYYSLMYVYMGLNCYNYKKDQNNKIIKYINSVNHIKKTKVSLRLIQNYINYKPTIINWQIEQKMLRVQPGEHYLKYFLQAHRKQDNYFIIPQKQIRTTEQLIDQILFRTFKKQESFLIILLRKFVLQLVDRKLSIPFLEEIVELLRQYESEIRQYKRHFLQLQEVMFQQPRKCQATNPDLQALQQTNESLRNCSFLLNPPLQSSPELESELCPNPSNQRFSKSLVFDIECYSEDSKYNFISSYDDKYFCSQYLTTSQDQKQNSHNAAIQQLKQRIQQKLKLQPKVSAFNYRVEQSMPIIDYDEQLKEWKRVKHSILKEPSFQGALAPQELDEDALIYQKKQIHYKQKIKSVLMRRRLTTKHQGG